MNHKPLEIQLLGPVELKFKDKPVKINRRIERVILYLLAVEHRPLSRKKLIDLLWPDADQIDPRASLRTALSRLRSELPDPDLIITELDQVILDSEQCSSDLTSFEKQYEQLQKILSGYQTNRSLPASIANQIQNVLNLWRGDEVISGDDLSNYPEVENWQRSVNRKLNHQRKLLISRLAQHYQNLGQLEKALSLFMQLSRLDNTDVSNQCAALDVLITMGRFQDAINYCDTLENIYEHQFGSPLPDEIITRCQQSQFRLIINQTEDQDQWPIPASLHLEMVGRQSELNRLINAYHRGGMVSIRGEMGSGKTRLVQELFHTISPTPLLLLAPSKEMESSLPFSPIIHALRQGIPANVWKEIDQMWVNQLSLLLPELTAYLESEEQLPYSRLPTGTRQIFDALHEVFLYTAKKYGRMLFFLDDAHWADVETLQALSYLISNGFFTRYGLLAIASRTEEQNLNLDLLIDQSYRSQSVERIHLDGLNQTELEILANQVLNEPATITFIEKLFQETSGNPFLALEIIRNILENQDKLGDASKTPSLPLPTNVHALMRKRLEQLDETSQHILRCAAVLGNNISPDLLQAVSEKSPAAFSNLLNPLLKSGFIYSDKKEYHNGYLIHFSHEKMREVILKESSDVQLQVLHRHAARLMAENSNYSDKAAVIANHFLIGDDIQNAFTWFLKAADHAWILGSKEETQQAYQQAEKLLNNAQQGFFKEEDLLQLYQQWGDFAYQSNQSELLEKTGVKLQYLGNRAKKPSLIGTSKILLANACFLRLEFDTALELIHSAINIFKMIDDQVGLITAVRRKSSLHWWTMEFNKMEEGAKRVLELSNNSELDKAFQILMTFSAKYLLDFLYVTRGQAKLSRQVAEELYKDYYTKLKPVDKLKSLYLLGYSNLLSGNYESSERFSSEGLEIANLLDNVLTGENLLLCLSKSNLIQGNLDQSFKYALKALESAKQGKRTINIVGANCIIGDIFFTIKNYTSSAQYYRIGQIREGYSNISIYGIENNIHLAQLLVWTDQLPEAQMLLDKNLAICQKMNILHLYVYGLMIYGIFHFHERQFSLAEEQFIEAIHIAQDEQLWHEWAITKISLSKLMVSMGEISQARRLIDQTFEISQSKNMVWPTLYGLELAIRLDEIQEQPELLGKHQQAYEHLLRKVMDNIQSEALRQGMDVEKRAWDQDHHFPS